MKPKKLQLVKCESCGDLIEREQGEDRECVMCQIHRQDGADIDDEYYD